MQKKRMLKKRKSSDIKIIKKEKSKKINTNKIPQWFLKECLNYNPNTGIFIWKERPINHFKSPSVQKAQNKKTAGKVAGHLELTGYISIRINTKSYLSHRLAWLYIYGYLPENQIDHINRIRTDNRIKNLREASQSCQTKNSKKRITNTSGVTGVCLQKKIKRWTPRITINYKDINLGCFKNFDDAVMARWKAEVKYNFPNCNSSSTAYQYLKSKGLL